MKNHPVNNDYVQNLQESLINEISKGAPLKEPLVKGGPKKKDPSPYAKGGPTKNRPPFKKKEEVQTESRRKPEGTPMGDLQASNSEKRREETQDAINTQAAEDGGSGVASDIEHGRWEPDIRDEGGSARTGKKKPGNKPKRGYKRNDGSKVTYPRTNTAGRRVEKNEPFTESYDLADSRLSDEELKVDKNVKTRGVKKKKGEKPVPMTNSDGEKIGEQDSGVRPRSQDLNTQGRLNKSREGEGIIAKGKRFIKKKFK